MLEELCAAQAHHAFELSVHSFDKLPIAEQVAHAAGAALMVGVHGAQLTHAMWMVEGSSLLEIHMRYGFCCFHQARLQQAHLRASKGGAGSLSTPSDPRRYDPPDPRRACGSCEGYAKPDYANIAHTFGLRYAYLDAVYIEPLNGPGQPNDRYDVHVNAKELAHASLLLLHWWQTSRPV